MKLISSYGVEILKLNKQAVRETLDYYRKALAFVIKIVNDNYEKIIEITNNNFRQSYVEKLIHSTKYNMAVYEDFDKIFYKMPSYFRRSCCSDAIGYVMSYRSNLANWEKSNKKTKEPKLQLKHNAFPTFYNGNMFLEEDGKFKIKLRYKNDWHWFELNLLKTDLDYLKKYLSHANKSSPILEKRYNKIFLRFCFDENISLNEININTTTVCAVDLGLNTNAVCSIMKKDGTILNRKFINFESDKDQLTHIVNRIKKKQRLHSSHNINGLWHYAQSLNDELAIKIANSIVDFAVQNNANVIVFEHLDAKINGNRTQMLNLWNKKYIQGLVKHKVHKCGIRISHICARNTSKLAFDGSGEVVRDKKNFSLATFKTKKKYNCDLNASYNIGARYFIREILKPIPAKELSHILAKVPECERRTSCTLNTLIQLNKVI